MEIVDRERYEVLKGMLEDRAREIVSKLRSLRQSLPDELAEVKDPEEQCVDEFARGLDFALIEMKSQTLARINDALLRLEEGSYGMCSDCDEEIGRARLQALPFAERCRDCQQVREEIAAETARQQSRFAEPRTEEAPAPARRGRPAKRAPSETSRPSARLAMPGQLDLRRQVSLMEHAGKRRDTPPTPGARRVPVAAAPAPAPERPARAAKGARARARRETKHAS
jgi:DnaK suppressor protein